MSAAATASAPAPQPGSGQAENKEPPARIARLLFLVRWLISYGQQAAATVRQRLAPLAFFRFAAPFGTSDIAVITDRIARGLRIAQALEQRLLHRAATGRDLGTDPFGGGLGRKPLSAAAKARAAERRAARRREARADRLPSAEEIAEMVRRRPIGALLAYICRDFGVMPGRIDSGIWEDLDDAITEHGGNADHFLCALIGRCTDPAFLGLLATIEPDGLAAIEPIVAAMPPDVAARCTGPP